jgi:hypothetical protein
MTATERPPWLPDSLGAHRLTTDDVKRLSYIVVDEIVDDVATLAVYPWPVADAAGRVRFPDLSACRHVALSRQALEDELYHGSLERDPRPGDVFGAVLTDAAKRRLARHDHLTWRSPRSLVDPPIYDMSADARRLAKLAYYAAMTTVLAKKDADRWKLTKNAEPPLGAATVLGSPQSRDGG